jgi:glutamate-ammonia-ligase adenylyltransferase
LGRCGELGLIPKDLAAQAIQAYRVLRKRQHALRLQGAERARVAPQEMKETRQAVRALWETVLGD